MSTSYRLTQEAGLVAINIYVVKLVELCTPRSALLRNMMNILCEKSCALIYIFLVARV